MQLAQPVVNANGNASIVLLLGGHVLSVLNLLWRILVSR
jgi:hypothetical protein